MDPMWWCSCGMIYCWVNCWVNGNCTHRLLALVWLRVHLLSDCSIQFISFLMGLIHPPPPLFLSGGLRTMEGNVRVRGIEGVLFYCSNWGSFVLDFLCWPAAWCLSKDQRVLNILLMTATLNPRFTHILKKTTHFLIYPCCYLAMQIVLVLCALKVLEVLRYLSLLLNNYN